MISPRTLSRYFFLLVFIWQFETKAQDLRKSVTYIDTYYNGEKHFSVREAAFVFYNPANSELYIAIDFSALKTGVDSLDTWLADLTDTKLVFKGHLPNQDLLALTQHNSKTMEIEGELSFNNEVHNHTIYVSFFEVSREGMLFVNTTQDYFDRISANIHFHFMPKKFGVQKKVHHLKKRISIAIGKAAFIEYKSEHENLLKQKVN